MAEEAPMGAAARSLTLDMALAALVEDGLLSDLQAKYVRERRKIQSAKLAAQRSAVEAESPVSLIQSFGLTPPGREKEPLEGGEIVASISKRLRIPTIEIDPLKLDSEAIVRSLPRAYAFKHAVLVLDPKARPAPVAVADPLDQEVLDTVRAKLGASLIVYIAPAAEILHLIKEIYGFKNSVAEAEKDLAKSPDIQNLEQFFSMRSDADLDATDSHIVRAVDHLFRYAFDQRASDIHIEPKRSEAVVRLRIDGVLHTAHRFSRRVHSAITSRLKTLARMDIAEKRIPQDGRIKTEYESTKLEMRVSTLPVAFGEKVVMRIFDPLLLEQDLSQLGLWGNDLRLVESFLARPHGIFLVTGPTGSGKTTTLYTALKKLSTDEFNISTVEDPIENISPEFNQVAVQPGIGLTFSSALRTLLRQDPDIIMVGEIRDSETAKMAIQAALTGHLVLSTLHTNDAPGAVNRLIDMGVEPFLLASTLVGTMAQRLVRSPCGYCAKEVVIPAHEAAMLGLPEDTVIKLGEGCPKCRQTGYIGRTGIFEVMPITKEIGDAIHDKATTGRITEIAINAGMKTLLSSGAEKVAAGATTPAEVLRHTFVEEK
ncbi:MAG: type II secretion system protein E [Deltaproteobacteria bacterium]|nr:MAG: type II secretion system protein E [Deltaproteobacteria bacterium]